jgi:hypothetical protein
MKKTLLAIAFLLAAAPGWAQTQSGCPPLCFYPNLGLPTTGGTLTGPLLLPDGTQTAPALSFIGDSTTGLKHPAGATGQIYFSLLGNYTSRLTPTGFGLNDVGQITWSSTNSAVGAADLFLVRDAANTLALRNAGTAGTPVPQTFNIYNFCDGAACATGYERGSLYWSGNSLFLDAQAAGTGTARAIRLKSANGVYIDGNLVPNSDDNAAYGLGGSAVRWSNSYISRSIQGSKNKVLTDAAAAASFVRIAVPTNGFAAGRVIYTATSTDGTNILVSSASCEFAAADTGGTVTAGTPTCDTPATAYKRANTLVCTISGAVSTTNYDLQATCTDNLAGSQTMSINYRLDMPQPNTVTPQ